MALVGIVQYGIKEGDLQFPRHLSCDRPQRSVERLTNTELAVMHLLYVWTGRRKWTSGCNVVSGKVPTEFSNLHNNMGRY